MTVNIERREIVIGMDQAKRLLHEKLSDHPNCRCSIGFYPDGEDKTWDTQRITCFWDAYFNRMSIDG